MESSIQRRPYSYRMGLDSNVGVAVLRLADGFDYSGVLADVDDMVEPKRSNKNATQLTSSG